MGWERGKESVSVGDGGRGNRLDFRTHAAVCRGEAEAAQSSLISRRAVTHLWRASTAAGGSGVRPWSAWERLAATSESRWLRADVGLGYVGVISANQLHRDVKQISQGFYSLAVKFGLCFFFFILAAFYIVDKDTEEFKCMIKMLVIIQ